MYPSDGITIRAHFAILAMQGLLASDVQASEVEFATRSVACADALIAELNKPTITPHPGRSICTECCNNAFPGENDSHQESCVHYRPF